MQHRTGRRQVEAPSADIAKPLTPEDSTAPALPRLLVGIVEVITGAALAQAVPAADFTAVAIPSGVDSMEAASGAAATGAAVIAEVNRTGQFGPDISTPPRHPG